MSRDNRDNADNIKNSWTERVCEPGWVILPLRVFLGIVFLDGGISKIADRRFLDDSSPTSMHANVLAVKGASPIGGLLGPVVDHSAVFGLLMAFGEIAVGLGVLLGLFTRLAAAGGTVLALSLWLTVSWQADPWFTSADVVYLFALSPLVIAGSGAVLSLDGWLAQSAARPPGPAADRTRRTLLAGAVAVLGVAVVGASSLFRRDARSSDAKLPGPATSSGSGGSGSGGEALAQVSDVPIGGGKQVTDPSSGDPAWVLQLRQGQFTALNAVCPHQGCPVSFVSPDAGFTCPCHGSTFDATGKRLSGPARQDLEPIAVAADGSQIRRT